MYDLVTSHARITPDAQNRHTKCLIRWKNNRTLSRDVFMRCTLSCARRASSYAIVKRRHVHAHKDDATRRDVGTRPSRLSRGPPEEGTLTNIKCCVPVGPPAMLESICGEIIASDVRNLKFRSNLWSLLGARSRNELENTRVGGIERPNGGWKVCLGEIVWKILLDNGDGKKRRNWRRSSLYRWTLKLFIWEILVKCTFLG